MHFKIAQDYTIRDSIVSVKTVFTGH